MENLENQFYDVKECFDTVTSNSTFLGEDTTKTEILEMMKIASNLMLVEQLKEVSNWIACLEETLRYK